MKKLLLIVPLMAASFCLLSQSTLSNGLYICYPLDGNATDFSGNAHNGSVFGATATTDRFGAPGMAMSFNGSNNYITVNNTFPDMAHFSVSVWVYHTNPLHPSGILSDADPAGYNDLFFNVSNDGVGIDANKPGGTVNKMDLYPLGNYGPPVTGQALNNAWHHIVWVCDSGVQKIYIDTVLKYSANISGTNKGYHNTNPSLARLGDGVSNGGYFQYFSGSMDEFKMYSRALNFTEVKTLFNGNFSCTGSACLPPTVSISGSTNLCSGNSTTLTASGTATSYTWSANAGSAHTNTVSLSPSSTTTYSVYGSDSSACPGMSTITINVTQTPILNVNGNTNICSGNTTTLTGLGATSYTWNTGSISVTSQSINANPGSSTTFTLSGANGSCVSSQTVALTVTPTPTLSISGLAAICSGSGTILSGSGATTYSWSANAGSATTSTVMVAPTSTTTFTLTGANGNCTAISSITVSVNPVPTLTISADPLTICSGYPVTMNGSGANTYTWSANAGSSNSNNISVTPQITTTYTLTGSNGFCVGNASITITVMPNPTITVSSATVCVGMTGTLTATGANSYTWTPQPQFTNSNSSVVLDVQNQTTTYTITGQDLNGCKGSTTTTLFVDSCQNSINSFTTRSNVIFYPSPTNRYLTIEISYFSMQTDYTVMNNLGSILKTGVLNSPTSEIDLADLPNGVYSVIVKQKDKINRAKIIIQR